MSKITLELTKGTQTDYDIIEEKDFEKAKKKHERNGWTVNQINEKKTN